MTIEVKVIADSVVGWAASRTFKLPTTLQDFLAEGTNSYRDGERITTLQLKYPRFIHAEFMTHRVFSRNASSSRAIPIKRVIQDILDDTAMPIHWGKHQAGMQANEETDATIPLGVDTTFTRENAWFQARDRAIEVARAYDAAGYHKQIVNRILEPFSHIRVVVTSTDWDNFFNLRAHPDAQPEIQALAVAMKTALEQSTPKRLSIGQWHIPYITEEDIDFAWSLVKSNYGKSPIENMINEVLLKISTARCARVSYLTHDGKKPTIDEEVVLYDRLVGSKPLHASPAEHQALLNKNNNKDTVCALGIGLVQEKTKSNFSGPWVQHRKFLEHKFAW